LANLTINVQVSESRILSPLVLKLERQSQPTSFSLATLYSWFAFTPSTEDYFVATNLYAD